MATPFMFPCDWSSPPQVTATKPFSQFRGRSGKEQRSVPAQAYEYVRRYSTVYTTSNKFESRQLEHTLSLGQGGTFLIPFYPEPLFSSAVDFQGLSYFTADSPNFANAVFSPGTHGDLSDAAHASIPGAKIVEGSWKVARLDYADWLSNEILDIEGWSIVLGAVVMSALSSDTFSLNIPLSRQAFFWLDEVFLDTVPDIVHLNDQQTMYTINWRSVR